LVGHNYLVTIHPGEVPEIAETVERWRRNADGLGHSVAVPVYSLLDALVDSYFPVIDEIAERTDAIEQAMFGPRGPNHLQAIFSIKRELLNVRRVLAPERETSPGRAHYFSPARQSAGKPIVTGWSYAWLAQLSFTHDSWTAPLDVQRVPAGGNAHAVAAAQIAELVEHRPAHAPVPLCVLDAGYDPETLARELADLEGQHVAVLVRLRSDRCFYADPPPATSSKVGRPRRHGQKFTRADERTWWTPTSQHHEQHPQYGLIYVRAWAGVHTKTHSHPAKGSYRPKATVRGTLLLMEVERLPRQTRIPRRLWLWWRGPGQPDLAVVWRAYVHRFGPGAHVPLL
jgi:CorA-like Mg2+ transporter protein